MIQALILVVKRDRISARSPAKDLVFLQLSYSLLSGQNSNSIRRVEEIEKFIFSKYQESAAIIKTQKTDQR